MIPKTGFIQMHSGLYFNLLKPQAGDINISDIARGLSHLCRFTGQTPRFYSVAQHSVYVYSLIEAAGGSPQLCLEALLHDAEEAYVGDVSAPLKALLPRYQEIARDISLVIRRQFGLPETCSPEIKHADLRLLAAERHAFLPGCEEWAILQGVEPAHFNIIPWTPMYAYNTFLAAFDRLTADRKVEPYESRE